MKILLGTDVLLAANDSTNELGSIEWLFQWFDKLKIKKCVDLSALFVMTHFGEINRNLIRSCKVINKVICKSAILQQLTTSSISDNLITHNTSESALNAAAAQLAFLEAGEVDYIISDNETLHRLSKRLNIDDRVYNVAEFIDKCSIEYREFDFSKGLIVEELRMRDLDINEPFFDSFKKDYNDYLNWFIRKSKDAVFISRRERKIIALLKLKIENNPSDFADIVPPFNNHKVLKISSFKIEPNRTKLAERFMRIIFNAALGHDVNRIYATLFDNYESKRRLKRLFEKWGFENWGHKNNSNEIVLQRDFDKIANYSEPSLSFPFHGLQKGVYLVYLDSIYANALLGYNIKSSKLYDIEPLKNSISKVLISYNIAQPVSIGSIIVFVTENDNSSERKFIGVGIVDGFHHNFTDEAKFLRVCRKRSIFTDSRLKQCWDRQTSQNRISTIEFLYACPLSTDVFSSNNIKEAAIDLSCLRRQEPKKIDETQFRILIKGSSYEKDFIVY